MRGCEHASVSPSASPSVNISTVMAVGIDKVGLDTDISAYKLIHDWIDLISSSDKSSSLTFWRGKVGSDV